MTDAITCDTALRTQVLHYKKCSHLHIPHLEDCGKAAPDAQTQFFKALWQGRASNIYIIWHQRRTEELKKKTFKGKPPDWSSSFLFSSIFCKVGPLHPILPDLGANETKKTLHPSFFRHVECIFWRVTIKCQKFQDLQKRTWMDLSSSLTRPVLRDS